MFDLSEPTRELAQKILTEVGFEHRLMGYSMHKRTGPLPVPMYSFEEIVGLLNFPGPVLDFASLETWVRAAMQDGELADAIGEAVRSIPGFEDRNCRVRDLMGWRLLQCRMLTASTA